MSKEDYSRPSDFDTSERFKVQKDNIEEFEDPDDIPDYREFEVYVKDLETDEISVIPFLTELNEANPAVKTGDFLYGAVEEAKARVAKKGYDIGEARKVR